MGILPAESVEEAIEQDFSVMLLFINLFQVCSFFPVSTLHSLTVENESEVNVE